MWDAWRRSFHLYSCYILGNGYWDFLFLTALSGLVPLYPPGPYLLVSEAIDEITTQGLNISYNCLANVLAFLLTRSNYKLTYFYSLHFTGALWYVTSHLTSWSITRHLPGFSFLSAFSLVFPPTYILHCHRQKQLHYQPMVIIHIHSIQRAIQPQSPNCWTVGRW